MGDMFMRYDIRGRPRRNAPNIKNLHHYRVDLFKDVIDLQYNELKDRFPEASTKLLLCIACLCPRKSVYAFDKRKFLQLAEFYPQDFSTLDILELGDELDTYIFDVRANISLKELKGLGDLAQKLVLTQKHRIFPLVYKLLTLVLILHVATATVERVFSAMSIVKDTLRNRMGDERMNDSLLVYVEKDMFSKIDNELIVQRFQNMKTCKGQL